MTAKKTAKKIAKKIAKKTAKKATKKTTKGPAKRPATKSAKTPTRKVSKIPAARTVEQATKKPLDKPEQESSAIAAGKLSKPGDLKKGKRPILVPVDFSAHSEAALAHAAHLAERTQVPLAVLHVVHDPGDAPGYYQVKGRKKQLRRLEDVAGEMFNKYMAKMIKRYPKLTAIKKAKRILVSGLPATRILEVAVKLEPRAVVMGSAGRTGLSRFLLGSKAEQLLRMCPYPVTIVKTAEHKR